MTGVPTRERLAALDVGSNSIRLLVAEFDPGTGLTVVDEVKDQPRLAAGLTRTGRLADDAMDRALKALRHMVEVCRRRGVSRLRAVATAAVRDAANGPAFVERVRHELDLPLDIIDPATEAQLSYRSVAHHFPLAGGRALVADIGGGSLELVGVVNGLVEHATSLPLGAVRLTELFLEQQDNPRKALRKLRKKVRKEMARAFTVRDWAGARVIGSGGTFTNLARVAAGRRGLSVTEAVHGATVGIAELEHLLAWLAGLSAEQRRAVAGLNPQRADIILAGLAVAAELAEAVDAPEMTVSAFGLREGLLLEMVGPDTPTPAPDTLHSVREFVDRCQADRRHAEQVRRLALLLLEQLGPELGACPEDAALLEAAALLHDVGQLVSYRRHHRHSYQLIMHADRLAFAARDRALIATISRYHRKTGPRRRHPEFAGLPEADQLIVRRLSGILRVADGLDRGHTAVVERLETALDGDRVTIRPVPRLAGADLSLECWSAHRKADVLARTLRREVVIAPGGP